MKRKTYSQEQIIRILKEREAGVPASEIIRKHGIANGTLYRWKSKYGGMDVCEAKRLHDRIVGYVDPGYRQQYLQTHRFGIGQSELLRQQLSKAGRTQYVAPLLQTQPGTSGHR